MCPPLFATHVDRRAREDTEALHGRFIAPMSITSSSAWHTHTAIPYPEYVVRTTGTTTAGGLLLTYLLLHSAVTVFPADEKSGILLAPSTVEPVIFSKVSVPEGQLWPVK